MSKLKESLIKKMDISPSKNFDTDFFQKLEREHSRPKLFSRWITWTVSGLATVSVLFIAITNYNTAPKHSFNHKEYVESVLEIQSTFNDDVSEPNDLTALTADEI